MVINVKVRTFVNLCTKETLHGGTAPVHSANFNVPMAINVTLCVIEYV